MKREQKFTIAPNGMRTRDPLLGMILAGAQAAGQSDDKKQPHKKDHQPNENK